MPSHTLDPRTALGVKLSATMSRHKYTNDPAAVVAELRELAGDDTALLAEEVGSWIGFYGNDEGVGTLTTALRGMTDLDLQPWIELGQKRRAAPDPGIMGRRPSVGA